MDLRETLKKGGRHPWEISRADMLARVVGRIVKNARAGIADIGAGDMYFDERLLEILPAAKITAVDICYDEKVKKPGIAIARDIRELPDNSQDVVIMMDVLEHAADDSALLRAAARKLRPASAAGEGLIVITVPAFQCLWSPKDDFVGHHRRYTSRTLAAAVKRAGLRPVKMQYYYSGLVPARIVEKLLKRRNDNDVGAWNWSEGSFVTRIVRFVLNADFMMNKILSKLGLSLFGLSIMVVAEKRSFSD